MEEHRDPTDDLRAGRRALEGMSGVILLEDWTWHDAAQKWALRLRLSPDDPGSVHPIPSETDWYLLAHADYPLGGVSLWPARDGGLTQTFPHQTYNGDGVADWPWRSGNACVATPGKPLGRLSQDIEPTDADGRLRWNVARTLEWLHFASRGELLQPGDPFELPQYPIGVRSHSIVAFSEGADTFDIWSTVSDSVGLVDLVTLKLTPSTVYAARQFRTVDGRIVVEPSWGHIVLEAGSDVVRGAWIRLPSVPVLPPWQAPTTWGELARSARLQGIHLADRLKPIAAKFRDSKSHVLLVGAPIPTTVAGAPVELHWQAIELPVLTKPGQKVDGFRDGEPGWWHRDRCQVFGSAQGMTWLPSENWHPDRLRIRGGLNDGIRDRHVVLVGAGALGSVVAEMLVRAGSRQVTVIDGDTVAMGNLVRHTLTLDVLRANKAQAIADRLNRVSPHADVRAITNSFPLASENVRATITECDIVVDCTGADDVLDHLARFPWVGTKLFASLSLGFEAHRIFCYAARADRFPADDFTTRIQPWLRQEQSEGGEYPWEGPGCWHPVFPARFDDVAMMAAAGVRFLESCLANDSADPKLTVYERWEEDDQLGGIRIATIPA